MSKRAAAGQPKGHKAKKAKVEPEPLFDEKNEDLAKAIQAVQEKLSPLADELELKIAELEYEYESKKQPIYEERRKAIAAIPKFWGSVIKNHPSLSEVFDEQDETLLNHLVDVDVKILDKHNSTKITFTFSPNDILEENVLWKQAKIKENAGEEDDPVEFTSSGVKLKAGKALDEDSFFNFFNDIKDENGSDEEILALIRESIWSDPLDAVAGDDFSDEDDGEDD